MPIDTETGTKLTYEDYVEIPADGKRHEIIDGVHVVNPAPRRATPRSVAHATNEKSPAQPGSLETGIPGRTRTFNLLIRSQVLYPIEPRVLVCGAGL